MGEWMSGCFNLKSMEMDSNEEFLKWYQPVHEPFVRYCSSRAYGVMGTEDLVQEAVLAALQGFDRIKEKDKLLGYMIGVVNNIIRNRKRRMKFQADWDEKSLAQLESKTQDPEIALDIHYLIKALDQLPDKQKEAVLLFEISGFSIKEISEIQDSSTSATKTRISRGRQQLRHLLSEDTGKLPLSKRLAIYASILM